MRRRARTPRSLRADQLTPTTLASGWRRRPGPAYDALARMRRERVQLGTVVDGDRLLGVVTLDDLLREVLPGGDPNASAVATPA